jgi:iron complex transport system substrate-binding protein
MTLDTNRKPLFRIPAARPWTAGNALQVEDISRRTFITGAFASALLIACGGDDDDEEEAASTPAASSGFPVSIDDFFGTVTISKEPARVVSVGRTDHDALLALGIQPLAVWRFVPTMSRGVGVWAEPKLTATPELLNINELDFEKIAGLAPDLILNIQSPRSTDQTQHDRLTAIATTISQPKTAQPNSVPWQEVTKRVATAVGRQADGEKMVSDTEAFLAKTGIENPAFKDKTLAVVLTYGGQIGVYKVQDGRSQILYGLGFQGSPYIKGLGDGFFQEISQEQINNLEADVVVVLDQAGRPQADVIAAFPLLGSLKAQQEGRLVYVNDFNTSLALSAASVLSIPYAVEKLLPGLKAATRA